MRLGKIALPTAAILSLLLGAAFQSASKPQQAWPQRMFAQAKAEDFVGADTCAGCHADQAENFHLSGHATFSGDVSQPLGYHGCESCHGPGKAHVDEQMAAAEGKETPPTLDPTIIRYGQITEKQVSAACLRCHGDVMTQSHFNKTAHAQADLSCVSCHQVHPAAEEFGPPMGDRQLVKKAVFPAAKPSSNLLKGDEAKLCGSCHRSEVAQFRLQSHHPLPEGRLLCSDCHNVHPVKAVSQTNGDHQSVGTLREGVPKHVGMAKDVCVNCHGDKGGPFRFEHDPVAGFSGNGCTECHRAHGSHNPNLLKAFSRGLCAQCHTDKGATHFPGRTCWQAGCHVGLHGSNTDPHLLQR